MEPDSTTGADNPIEATTLLKDYVDLKNNLKQGKFNVMVLHHATIIPKQEREKAVLVGCIGCGAEIKGRMARCPKEIQGPECLGVGAWLFLPPNKTPTSNNNTVLGRHRLNFDLVDF